MHDYGDVCQSVTELAVQQGLAISTDEFRTLNRCLDNAIADAVVAFGAAGQVKADARAETLQQRLVNYIADQKRLNAIASQAFTAVKTGNIGPGGATGDLLVHTLKELDELTDPLQSPPDRVPNASPIPFGAAPHLRAYNLSYIRQGAN